MNLSGKVALVTGGLGDLGNEMALHLALDGATVALWDIKTKAESKERVQRVEFAGGKVLYQKVDISNRKQVDAGVTALVEELGGLDIVCANAGIVESKPFLEIPQDNWQRHVDVNLTGTFNVGQAVARQMVKAGTQGRIILTSSWVADIPWPENTAYNTTKAGVNMLMKQMARELAVYGIRVNAVAPGIVKAGLAGKQLREEPQYAARVSKVIPLGEPGTPTEIGQAVVYLAGPMTTYMTGSVLLLDGGCSLFQFDN